MIEVLIATVLIVLGLVLYAVVSGNIMAKNAETNRESIAITLAQDKLEEIKNTALTVDLVGADGFDSPTYSTDWSATPGGEVVDSEGNSGTSSASYTRTWTITYDAILYYFYTVNVTVAWNNGNDSISLVTYISQ
ncbi:hypothetical protein UR09_00495 [Candidatus Nitromaritima sp. SCGC AAA799-A02]|nr:hypothetical protein UR09_00495 [Candidatus Nitromaritima sp. SCGC AAA799-A02]